MSQAQNDAMIDEGGFVDPDAHFIASLKRTGWIEYQRACHELARYADAVPEGIPLEIKNLLSFWYVALGLGGEAGEISNKAKKILRDSGGEIDEIRRAAFVDELGDVLWYAAEMSTLLGVDLADVADRNMAKLNARKDHGTLKGSGDNR